MKLSHKFTVYIIGLAVLLGITGAIAAIYGTRLDVAGYEASAYPGSLSQSVVFVFKRVVSNPAELANHLFYVLTIIGFGITLLIVLKLRRKLLKPLLAAVKFSLALADNQFPPKLQIPDEKNDEVNELISSLNFMRDRLQSTFLKLQASHESEKSARLSSELLTQMRTGYIQHIVPDILECIDVVSNNMEIIRRELKPGLRARESTIFGIRRALKMLDRHFNRLMELSRIGIGKDKIVPEKLKCFDFIDFVVRYSAELFEPRGILVKTDYNPGMPSIITVDPQIMRMLITMAIHVAADNAEPGETIHCTCFSKDGQIVFEIRDAKQSEPRDYLIQIYEEFMNSGADISQADKRLTNLLVLREWVQALDGRIELADNGENFNIRVRLVFSEWELFDNSAPEATFSQRLSNNSSLSAVDDLFEPVPAKILLAESNNDLISTAKVLLGADHHTVDIVSNVADLLGAAASKRYDAIAISLHISENALRKIIDSIRTDESPNRHTIIAVISSSPFLNRDDFKPEEVKYFITRPVNFQMLRQLAGRCHVASSD